MGKDTRLAALIGSRICHDLISPIGAINNGLELLGMIPSGPAPEMELISQSVSSASARIRFFRVAFGAADNQMVGRPEVSSILQDVYVGSRLTVAWGPLDPQPRRLVRLALLALLCMETGMPYGGRVEIDQDDDNLTLTGHADKLNIDPDLWGLLGHKKRTEELRPAHVQFGLLPIIAQEEGRKKLRVTSTETKLMIQI